MSGILTVLQPGNSVVTDLGRFRGARYGLPVNGALDQFSARIANVLVGNADNSPLIEVTALDFRMRTDTDILISVTGSPLTFSVGGRPQQQWEPVAVRAGETVSVRGIHSGLRAYIAVHGAVEAPLLLGSCAPDTVIGFGLKLAEGSTLTALRSCAPFRQPYLDLPLFRFGLSTPAFGPDLTVDVTDGPDLAEFGDSAELLFAKPYTVSGRSNHIGLRLGGELPQRVTDTELLSRGVPVGAIEVPSRDELLVLHRGRGVTAGYPVLAVVTSSSLDTLAQARPGQHVTFRKSTIGEAAAKCRSTQRQIDQLRQAVTTVFASLGIGTTAHWWQHHASAAGF
ncbi:allophanate hydrolase [Arthrobacter sp. ERGS1:01]|uniref:5-oxoprolinase subunit C family protein n=1 Tax=Arthrobacter sp. ERGS1:01 TaxID=1704044 RepID=UPI0006B620A1|nr:biotin-dependent carboxyltransferase family protein [Arthrobacter sp. ERGS1:01]ALE07406.1 allophanate hydrolase [Arthrobacter sp. ERGS1:01]